jgi:hypothetical protein
MQTTPSTTPQTVQQQVLSVVQRIKDTRRPGMTMREILASYQARFGGRLTVDDIKQHAHALTTAGALVGMERRGCTINHGQPAHQVRAA